MGAMVDCEALRSGFLGQPANSLSSLAFVIAGLWLLRRNPTRWVGLALTATGAGSFLFHGPLAPNGVWIHDVTLAWLLAVILVEVRGWPPTVHLAGAVVLAAGFAVSPGMADVTMGGMAVATAAFLLLNDHSRRTMLPLALLATSAIVGRLGSTGGPLCTAGSLLQTHTVWHIGAAIAVTWWARGMLATGAPSPDV